MKLLCFRSNSKVILDSPDRENIKISTLCIPNKDKLEKVFCWLIDTLRNEKKKTQKTYHFLRKYWGCFKDLINVFERIWSYLYIF